MKKYLENLRPLERRLVIGVVVVVVVVLNWAFVWPHFSDFSNYERRLNGARSTLARYQAATVKIPDLKQQLAKDQQQGDVVAQEDQSIDLMRTIQSQASGCGFGIQNFSRSLMTTNQFFVEQQQNITVQAPEAELVDFLYQLGNSPAMIRVRDLSLQPDPPHQRLSADIRLVASYQKNSLISAAPKETAKAK
jgi:Tfp pilus assembly protein PilO